MTKPINNDPKDNREYLPIGEELGIGANPDWFKKAPESMYFNELVYAVAFSREAFSVISVEVVRSFNDGKINAIERDALRQILERMNGGK